MLGEVLECYRVPVGGIMATRCGRTVVTDIDGGGMHGNCLETTDSASPDSRRRGNATCPGIDPACPGTGVREACRGRPTGAARTVLWTTVDPVAGSGYCRRHSVDRSDLHGAGQPGEIPAQR